MTTIAHLADLHLGHRSLGALTKEGQNQRQADFEAAALLVADYLIANPPDIVIVCGDLLNETNIALRAMNGAAIFCRRITDAGIPLIAIGGNHDEAESQGRYNGLQFLSKHHGLTLLAGQMDIAGVRLHGVPYRTLSRAERMDLDLPQFDFAADKSNILMTHGYAEGTFDLLDHQELIIPQSWLEDDRFDLVCLGHIHIHRQISKDRPIFYSGSTERRNFGEAEQRPGFYVHEIGGASKSVYLDQLGDGSIPRPMLVKEIDTSEMTSKQLDDCVCKIIDELPVDEMMLKLKLFNVSSQLDRTRARDAWRRRFRAKGGFYLDAVTQTRQIRELLDIKFAAPPVDLLSALTDFLSAQTYASDDERERIQNLASEIYALASESVVQQREGE
jgi:DNA repair exonuclease SbcCD nuclease subunit